VTVFNAAAFLMGLISPESIAAYAIAIQVASFAFMVPLGLGMAATVRVGRAYGARDWDGAARAGAAAWWLALGYACCTILIMTLGRRELVGLFLPLEDAANQPVIELAMSFVAFAGFFQFFDCSQGAAAGMLRGLQDTRVPMILTAVGYWGVGLPLSILLAFPLGLEGTGIWIGLAAGLAVVAGLLTYRWLKREQFGLVGDSVAIVS
jgi:MATE family multidrug resistance protein